MSDFVAFARLGFGHIVSFDALDHLLFLLALSVVYRFRDWRSLLLAISSFTVGHSVTLALAVMNVVRFPAPWIELLIPVTIVATAVTNLLALRDARVASPRVALVGVFGLIHGAASRIISGHCFSTRSRSRWLGSTSASSLGRSSSSRYSGA